MFIYGRWLLNSTCEVFPLKFHLFIDFESWRVKISPSRLYWLSIIMKVKLVTKNIWILCMCKLKLYAFNNLKYTLLKTYFTIKKNLICVISFLKIKVKYGNIFFKIFLLCCKHLPNNPKWSTGKLLVWPIHRNQNWCNQNLDFLQFLEDKCNPLGIFCNKLYECICLKISIID